MAPTLRPITAESLFSPLPAESMSRPQKREKTPQKREKTSLQSPTEREATTTQAVIISNSQVPRRARLRRCGLRRHLVGEGRLSHAAAAVTELAWPCAFSGRDLSSLIREYGARARPFGVSAACKRTTVTELCAAASRRSRTS